MTTNEWLDSLQVGDRVVLWLAGRIPQQLTVTARTEKYIMCGPWTFNPMNGAEIDENLGFDGVAITGSYIQPPDGKMKEHIMTVEEARARAIELRNQQKVREAEGGTIILNILEDGTD